MHYEKPCANCGTSTAVLEPDATALCLGCEPVLASSAGQANSTGPGPVRAVATGHPEGTEPLAQVPDR
jgi:hypothetical protein